MPQPAQQKQLKLPKVVVVGAEETDDSLSERSAALPVQRRHNGPASAASYSSSDESAAQPAGGRPSRKGRHGVVTNTIVLPAVDAAMADMEVRRPSAPPSDTGSALRMPSPPKRPSRAPSSRASSVRGGGEQLMLENTVKDMELASKVLPDVPQRRPAVLREKKVKDPNEPFKLYVFRCLEVALRKFMWNFGSTVATYTYILMIIPVLVLLLTTIVAVVQRDRVGFSADWSSFVPTTHSVDFGSSPSPLPSSTENDQLYTFNSTNPAYDAISRLKPTDFAVLLKTKSKRSTVLQEEAMDAYFAVQKAVRDTTARTESQNLTYTDLCRKPCAKSNVVERLLQSGQTVALTYPETLVKGDSNNNFTRLFIGTTFGGVDTDADGAIARARSLAMYYRLAPAHDREGVDAVSSWDRQLRAMLVANRNLTAAADLQLSWWTYGSFMDSVAAAAKSIYLLLPVSLLILTVASVLCCMAGDSYSSKPLLGVTLAFCIVFAIVGGVGIEIAITAQFHPYVYIAFFPITGCALLMALTLLQSWRKYSNVAVHPTEKLQFVLCWDGACTAASAACLVVACALTAVVTTMPFLRQLFVVAAASLLLLAVFLAFLYMVMLYADGRRENAGVKWFNFCSDGDTHFPLPLMQTYTESELLVVHSKLCDVEPTSLSRRIGSQIARPQTRYVALLFFVVYFIFGIWGCTTTNISLREEHVIAENSEPYHFLTDYRQFYGRYEEYVEITFDDVLDYINPETRDAILQLLDWVQEKKFTTRVVSWFTDFLRFEQSSIYLVNSDTFVPVVNLVFLKTEPFKVYKSDIVFDKYHSQIVSSRMYLELSRTGMAKRSELINGLLSLARTKGIPMRVKTPFVMLLSHDLNILPTALVAFALFCCLISFAALVIFGQPFIAIVAIFSCLSVGVCGIGYSMLWRVPFNVVTVGAGLVNLVLTAAITFHFCYHFIQSGPEQRTAERRTAYAFQTTFYSTLAALVVPLLCALPLLFASSPMTVFVVKLFCIQLLLSLFHYVLFVPALMIAFVYYLPQLCSGISQSCSDACGPCCDMEGDTGSIYYIPTTGRSLDPETLQRFLGNRYGDVTIRRSRALPPPPTRPMLMAPPEMMGHHPDLVSAVAYRHYQQPRYIYSHPPSSHRGSCRHASAEGSLRNSPVCSHGTASPRHRRSKSVSPEPRKEGDGRSPSPSSPPSVVTATKRSFALQVDDGKSVQESIYEEPPSLANGSVYVVERQSNGERKMVPESGGRSRRSGASGTDHHHHHHRRTSHHHHHRQPREYSDDECQDSDCRGGHSSRDRPTSRHIDLRPNWRQFLLDGAIRKDGAGSPTDRYHHGPPLVVQAPPTIVHVPVLAAPSMAPPLPPMNSRRLLQPPPSRGGPPKGLPRIRR